MEEIARCLSEYVVAQQQIFCVYFVGFLDACTQAGGFVTFENEVLQCKFPEREELDILETFNETRENLGPDRTSSF